MVNMQGVEGDQKLKEWYKQLYEEERSRDSIILQQFSLGMIVIGVLISTMVMVQSSSIQCKTFYQVGVSIIGIAFLFILTLYIRHASDDKLWARDKRVEIEERWGFIKEGDKPPYLCPCRTSAIKLIESFFEIIIIFWIGVAIYLIYVLCGLPRICG
ncbi:MAG: hypothetical protein QMC85_07615 [Methanocellales archaeon]|nr:hypothetical protein [Methanocellales archaeon]